MKRRIILQTFYFRPLAAVVCVFAAATLHAETSSEGGNSPKTLDLKECVQVALERNFDILEAKARVEKEYQVSLQIRARMLPTLEITGSDQKSSERGEFSGNLPAVVTRDDLTGEIQASQTLFEGGRNIGSFRAQKLRVEAAKRALEAQINSTIFKVKKGFLDALLKKAKVKVEEENIRLLDADLGVQKLKRDAKIVSDFNVLRAEVALSNAKAPLIRAQNDAALSLEELRGLLGLEVPIGSNGAGTLDIKGKLEFSPITIALESALDEAVKSRPDLREVEILHRAAELGIQIARAGYLPTVRTFGSYRKEHLGFSQGPSESLDGWTGGLQLSWKIFDGLETTAKKKEAAVDERLAKIELERLRLGVDVDVRRAFFSLQNANALVKASYKVIAQAEESLRLARARFDANAATQLDILDAQVRLTEARTNEIQALHDYSVARAALETAMGIAHRTL